MFSESADSADGLIGNVLGNKKPSGKKGEYVGEVGDVQADFDKLTDGKSKEYPNGTKVGQMDDGSKVETHKSSGKGTSGQKGVNVDSGASTIKLTRPSGKGNITIRYPSMMDVNNV